MWIHPSSKSFTNYALKYIENPLFMVVAGSRMYGFNDEDSDWDVYAVFIHPSINLFRLEKPASDFITPERSLYKRKVSVKVEEVEQVFNKIICGNMKTFERIYSHIVTMRTDHYHEIRKLGKYFFTQKLVENYLENIELFLVKYQEQKNIKFLIYALRSSMTANILVKTKVFTLNLQQIYKLYPNTNLKELVDAKINKKTFNNIYNVLKEVEKLKTETIGLLKNLPKEANERNINSLNDYLVSLRLQHIFSKAKKINFV
ncbi:DNA polymerase beta superfamily protein [Neobacillus vireti]|uniref:DNA polymerase beta superfamily protein n=1 Tax=Neobacillus vireti TaxID=220686 RepID=UPI002FFDEE39